MEGLGTQRNTSKHARVHTHKRAIITLLRHRRESSGKPKEAEAQRGVNRKRVTHILVATHTYNERKNEPKPRVPPHEARGKSVVTEQEEESFTSTHQFYSYWRCYHKCEGVRCYVLEINECSQRKAFLSMNHCLKWGPGSNAAPQNVAEGKF